MAEAFFEPDGERFVPTDWARGPWTADASHAGPPAALLGRAVEALDPTGPAILVSRFSMEILRPVPLRPLTVRAAVARPGRRVQLAEASLLDGDVEVIRASVWRIRPNDDLGAELRRSAGFELVDHLEPHSFERPEDCPVAQTFSPGWEPSYFDAIEWRTAAGDWLQPGLAAMWMRMRVDLVAGEVPSPLSRVRVSADSANGISWELPIGPFLFANLDLTLHLARMPEGDWVCVDAVSWLGPNGLGVAQSRLWDQRGRFGAGAQSLLVSTT
jgi:hypothetical protein